MWIYIYIYIYIYINSWSQAIILTTLQHYSAVIWVQNYSTETRNDVITATSDTAIGCK